MMYAWIGLLLDASEMMVEAQQVVALRLEKLAAGGPAATIEAATMIAEKTTVAGEALLAASAAAVKSGDPRRSAAAFLRPYRRKVRANRRRLSR